MYTLEEIAALRKKCIELGLENVEILEKYTDRQLQKICNGIGPELLPDVLRELISKMRPTLQPVAFIHDVEWYESDGEHFTFSESNARFRTNGHICAKAAYPWYHPCRYLVMLQADRLASYCQMGGWAAFMQCYRERKAQQDG